jgi:CHAT domain-containing protein/tetratricopeptide (TPR) repeat protein
VTTLKTVAALPPATQARLAEADRADEEVRRLFVEGDYEAAAGVIRRQLAVRREILGDDHIDVAISMDDLATVHCTVGDFAAAEPLLRQALLLNRRLLGADHPNLARAMNNLSTVIYWQGNHEAATTLCREALAMNRRLLGDNHPHVVTDLGNLGVLLGATGDLTGAEAASREAVARSRTVFGEQSPDLVGSLQNLARNLRRKGDHATAEDLLREALAMSLSLFDEEDATVARSRHDLARQLTISGDYGEAEYLFRRALASDEARYGSHHPQVVFGRYWLANLFSLQGRYAAAETAWIAAREGFEIVRRRTSLGWIERASFMGDWSPFERLAACLARNGKPRSAWEQLEAHLARGLLDALSARISQRVTQGEHDIQKGYLDRLTSLDDQISAIAQSGDSTVTPWTRLDSLRWERERQQTALSLFETDLAATHGELPGGVVGLEGLEGHLAEDEAILAWIDLDGDPHAADPNGEHWACVVRKTGEPRWTRLHGSGEAGAWIAGDGELSALVGDELGRPQQGSSGEEAEARARLCRQRIAPVENHLSGVRHLLVIPSGWMARIPVEALTDAYTVSYAPSATIFVSRGERLRRDAIHGALLAVGDPALYEPGQQDQLTVQDEPIARLRSDAYLPLPGTRAEVETIARLFEDANTDSVPTVMLGSNAREQALCAAAAEGELSRFCFIHLATHAVMNDRTPMQSYLVLSRENLRDAVDRAVRGEAVYDGVITAEQILRTWRLDAELVTLSACETALGMECSGEGYLGFSQALFVAGARSLLLSLWKVEDRATRLLMTRFYENMLGVHRDPRTVGDYQLEPGARAPKAVALHEAKQWLRTLTVEELEAMEPPSARIAERGLVPVEEAPPVSDGDRPYAHPHFWAAFILTGDPR